MAAGWSLCLCFVAVLHSSHGAGMLFPRESETRSIQELNGMWEFRADMSSNRNKGMQEKWYTQRLAKTGPVLQMPVPSSYNDITTDRSLRDFVGWVWYDREVFVRPDMNKERIVLRIDSAHYYSKVWINGKELMEHVGGHLPFEGVVNDLLDFSGPNYITVAVNNTLGPHTLPPGSIATHKNDPRYPAGYFTQNLQFDFFNYAGIHRRVRFYTTPKNDHVDDIDITPSVNVDSKTAIISYQIGAVVSGGNTMKVEIYDKDWKVVGSALGTSGNISISDVQLWEPYSASKLDYAYRYHMKVSIMNGDNIVDAYRQPFGLRSIEITPTQILINKKPFYCHGAAKHEDSDIRGKGLDFALIARDFEMIKWLGINCFRTSHYPYAEEIMDEADKRGVVVIDECPGVGITSDANFEKPSLDHHLRVMEELVTRDKNRPSVVFWSVANEPASGKKAADYYFKTVISHTRSVDPQKRPVTFVSASEYNQDKAVPYVDIICINRYYGWYQDTGHLEVIGTHMSYDLDGWHAAYKKPVIITEYGADTVSGLHTLPSFVFTEDYQAQFLHEYHKVYDVYRKKFLAGEMVWNFADFMTDETVTRVVGNKKGLLTRQRQPKMAAYVIRERYWSIINGTQSKMDPTLRFTPWLP